MTRSVNLRKIRVDIDQLNRVVLRLNEAPGEHPQTRRLLCATFQPQHRLVVYGSLAPGESNHDKLDGVDGVWEPGVVHGVLHDRGWDARLGYPARRWSGSRTGHRCMSICSRLNSCPNTGSVWIGLRERATGVVWSRYSKPASC